MATKAKIGDVFEIGTSAGLAYVQYTHENRDLGQLVRVLHGLYLVRPDIGQLVREREMYFTFYLLNYAMRDGLVLRVSTETIPEWAQTFPTMRKRMSMDHTGRTLSWGIGSGLKQSTLEEMKQLVRVRDHDLTPEQKKLSIGGELWPHPVMVEKLAEGWTPECDEEIRLQAVAEAEAKRLKGDAQRSAQPKAQFLDHHLYFSRKSHAEKAAANLRERKGWLVDVKKSADGERWLTLAHQPAPIDQDIDQVRDELEQLADQFHGEYDGWGANV